ncbi:M48 family metallopeptidase [Natrialbaceae archaeon GCM10025810]|uniref:M48 family metallopeptidase n=1 Tax=Halovalidus salilacus TaxID=3075124 RepID=UPI00360B2A9D
MSGALGDGLPRTTLGLGARMVVAVTLCLALTGTVAGVAIVLVGIPIYVLLSGVAGALETVVSPQLGLVVALALAGGTLFTAECAIRAVRAARSESLYATANPIAEGVVELAVYAVVFSSLAVLLGAAPFLRETLPTPVFALGLLLLFFYAFTGAHVWAGRRWVRERRADDRGSGGGSRNDGHETDDDEPGWTDVGALLVVIVGLPLVDRLTQFLVVVAVALTLLSLPDLLDVVRGQIAGLGSSTPPSNGGTTPTRTPLRNRARATIRAFADRLRGDADHRITIEARRTGATLERLAGSRARAVALLGVGAFFALGGAYAAASIWPTEAVTRGLTAVSTVAFVGSHLGSAVRSELTGDVALLRDLEVEGEDERVFEGAETADLDGDGELADLQATVDRLARQADVPPPTVRIAESRSRTPTALTVGYRPSTSTIVVTRALLEALDDREREAVLAHELAHVANRDAAVMTALTSPGAIASVAGKRYGVNPLVAIPAAIVYAVGRWYVAFVARVREYAADDGAVTITGDPAALASALETLDSELEGRPETDLRDHRSAAAFSIVPPPWEEHRFFDRTRRFVARGLLGTHPPTETRIERLRSAV